MNFVVPAPSETFDVDLEDGAKILIRRHGNRDGMRLTVTHGNGFAADAYLPFWQLLTPRYDVLVFDFRNHGRNVPVEPSTTITRSSRAISTACAARSTQGSARNPRLASSIPCPGAPP
jgi:pimeloyl-ACP methyl ester carboxylesterase